MIHDVVDGGDYVILIKYVSVYPAKTSGQHWCRNFSSTQVTCFLDHLLVS